MDSRSCMSVSLFDLQPEALAIGSELRMECLDVRANHISRIPELAVPVGLVVLQVAAHRPRSVRTERDAALLVEPANGSDRVADEVRVSNVVYAWIVDQRIVESRVETWATRCQMHTRLF